MISRALEILALYCRLSTLVSFFRWFWSRFVPSGWPESLGIRHRGQGSLPMLRIPLRLTLAQKCQKHDIVAHLGKDVLFRIICWVGEYSKIKTSLLAVATLYHYAMLISFQEIVVEQLFPLCMKKFSLAMGQKCFTWSFIIWVQCCKVLKLGRQLYQNK